MDSLGLDYDTLKERNPRLIYCSLTGYGQTGPLSRRAGHDINYMSRSGNMAQAGRKKTGPVLTNMQIADMAVGSMNSVISILAAVQYRHTTGEGQYIDVAMLDGMIPFHSMDGACFLVDRNPPQREEQLLNGGGIYDFYQTSDGRYMSVGSLEPKFFANLCMGTGFSQWADGNILKENAQMVKAELRKKFKTKTQAEWIAIFKGLDACVEPVLSMEEMLHDPQIEERGMLPHVPMPFSPETVQQLGCPLKLSKCPPEYKHAGYPEGYHTEEILSRLGYSAEEIAYLSK